jgi:methyl-accepting chemotaxis protein
MSAPAQIRMTIGRRLLAIFTVQFVMVAALGTYAFVSMWQVADQVGGRAATAVNAAAQSQEMYQSASAAMQLLDAQSATGTSDLTALDGLRARFGKAAGQLPSPEAKTKAEALMAEALKQGQALVQAAAAQQWTEAGALRKPFREASSALLTGLDAIRDGQAAELRGTLDDARQLVLRRAVMLVVGFVLTIVAGVFMSLRLRKAVVTPLTKLSELASKIAQTGDLTQALPPVTHDEVGDLTQAFGTMVAKLKELLGALQESVQLLSNAGAELSRNTADQGQTLTRQATALQETQVTAQEIKQTSLLAASKAEAVIALTEKADQISASGEGAIERSLDGLSDIRAQVGEIAVKISELSTRTKQIGGITQTVKDLADQSNMLALNAAIEAARSGEHGKGFAVVAREIRSLADQSVQATNRVREILEDIGGAIDVAVNITGAGTQKIEGGVQQVRQSGENLRELSSIVRDNSAAVRQIAAAVSQQNAGITQIFSAVTDQTRMMDATMKGLEGTTQSAGVMKDLSQRVSEVVKRFRV